MPYEKFYGVRVDYATHYNAKRLAKHEDRNISKVVMRLIREGIEKSAIGWEVPSND